MGFEITLPENVNNREDIITTNKKMFSDDLEKGGFLAKILVFTKLNEPLNSQDLNILLQKYYKIEFDINIIKRGLKKLNGLGIIYSSTSGDVMMTPQNEMSRLYKEIYRKFLVFLEHIPKQFRKQYNGVNYYWVPKGDGYEYLEWCCRLLKFPYKKSEDKNEQRN